MAQTTLNSDYRDLLQTFCDYGVEFMIVGAHALSFHGHSRYTDDFDVWIRPTPENAQRVYHALAAFGAPLQKVAPDDFTSDDLIFQIGVAPIRIDVITAIEGVLFDEVWPDRVSATYGGVPVSIIGREALIKNKRAAARPKDLADVEALESIGPIAVQENKP